MVNREEEEANNKCSASYFLFCVCPRRNCWHLCRPRPVNIRISQSVSSVCERGNKVVTGHLPPPKRCLSAVRVLMSASSLRSAVICGAQRVQCVLNHSVPYEGVSTGAAHIESDM